MKYLLIAILLLGAVSAQYFSQEEVKDSPMMTEDQPEDAYFWHHVRRFVFGDKANMEDMPEDAYFWHHVRRFVFGDKADMEESPESADIFFTAGALAAKFAGKHLLKHALKRGAKNWFSSWFRYA